nr:hypothetical protein BaRGS_032720 [Batillaria attramentaria]
MKRSDKWTITFWVTPSGDMASTKYENGYFYLHLPNPVKGGNYTCILPANVTATACVSTGAGLSTQSAIFVDKMEARVALLEAENMALKKRTSKLEDHVIINEGGAYDNTNAPPTMEAGNLAVSETRTAVYNNLTHTWHVQLTCGTFTDLGQPPVDVVWKKAELAQQKVENADLMQKNTELARQLDQYHGENVQLTNQLGNLTHYVHSLENQLCSSHSTANHGVSFHARLSSEQQANAPDSVILDHVITNEGGAYSPTTGVFTVPVNGTYVVFIAAGTTTSGTHAGLYLMVDNDWMCYTDSKDTDGSQSSSCQAVVHLVKGQRVWLKAGGTSSYWHYATYFGGVLVRVD